jgi:hypothetical protein
MAEQHDKRAWHGLVWVARMVLIGTLFLVVAPVVLPGERSIGRFRLESSIYGDPQWLPQGFHVAEQPYGWEWSLRVGSWRHVFTVNSGSGRLGHWQHRSRALPGTGMQDSRAAVAARLCCMSGSAYFPMQYRNWSERRKSRPPATAGLALNMPRSPSSLAARTSNFGAAGSTYVRPLRAT